MAMQRQGAAIDSHTVLYGVIGDPVRHSRSPVMMNRAFAEAGINGAYLAFHIVPDRLGAFVEGIRAMSVRGVNVTIPHKVNVMRYLDEIDDGARAVGAVNTIVSDGGKLKGYNTDGIGYVRSLREETAGELAGKRILVLGAGGAARGIVYGLALEKPARITIANRTPARAEELSDALGSFGSIYAIGQERLEEACGEADIVVNTTSAGMHPNTEDMPLGLDTAWLRPDAIASDIIYNPMTTRFLKEAENRGCPIHGGLGMFIYQGAYAFEYWTGIPAPVDAMRETVLAALR